MCEFGRVCQPSCSKKHWKLQTAMRHSKYATVFTGFAYAMRKPFGSQSLSHPKMVVGAIMATETYILHVQMTCVGLHISQDVISSSRTESCGPTVSFISMFWGVEDQLVYCMLWRVCWIFPQEFPVMGPGTGGGRRLQTASCLDAQNARSAGA